MSYADAIASVSITRATRTPSQQGFGTPLVAVYHTLFADRVRQYSEPDAMLDDGFLTSDPAYKIVSSIFAQNPAPPVVKIGRRALPFTQVVHLTPSTPALDGGGGAIPNSLDPITAKIDGLSATYTTDASPTLAEACTGLAAAINALTGVDADAIIATGASTTTDQTLSGASLDGVIGDDVMSPARRLSLTVDVHADWNATTAIITGTSRAGAIITENFTIPDGGQIAALNGTKYFRTVTSVFIPTQGGPGGTFTVGVRAAVTAVATGGTHIVCTAAVAGELHSYELVTSNLSLADLTADPVIATDLAAIQAADADWYGLLLDSNSAAEITGAATWIESAKKLFVWQNSDSASLSGSSTTDIFYTTKAAGYVRSGGIYYPSIGTNWAAAAWTGEEFPKDAGQSTWMFKTLAGITVYDLTDTQRAALEAKDGNHYLLAGGIAITGPGESSSGDWLDVVRDLDWLTARLRERQIGVFVANDKVPFTDDGISLLVTAVRAQLTEATDKTVLAKDPKFTLTAPRASAVSAANKRARHLPDVRWSATLAGAIHSVTVSGLVSL